MHFQMHRVRKFAQRVRKPDEPHKSNSVENLNKNKVCAGLEVVANDTLSPPKRKEPQMGFFCFDGESGIKYEIFL